MVSQNENCLGLGNPATNKYIFHRPWDAFISVRPKNTNLIDRHAIARWSGIFEWVRTPIFDIFPYFHVAPLHEVTFPSSLDTLLSSEMAGQPDDEQEAATSCTQCGKRLRQLISLPNSNRFFLGMTSSCRPTCGWYDLLFLSLMCWIPDCGPKAKLPKCGIFDKGVLTEFNPPFLPQNNPKDLNVVLVLWLQKSLFTILVWKPKIEHAELLINTDMVHVPRYRRSPKKFLKPPSRESFWRSRWPWNLGEQSARASILMLHPRRKASYHFRSCRLAGCFGATQRANPHYLSQRGSGVYYPVLVFEKQLIKTMFRVRTSCFLIRIHHLDHWWNKLCRISPTKSIGGRITPLRASWPGNQASPEIGEYMAGQVWDYIYI